MKTLTTIVWVLLLPALFAQAPPEFLPPPPAPNPAHRP